jgi:ribonuclease VapC
VIAVDTSALMAIALREQQARACMVALHAENEVVISAGTLAEALIVSMRRGVGQAMSDLLEEFAFQVVAVSPAAAWRIGRAYEQWGRGVHPASLNFGDCFAYEVAREYGCPLLYVGDDFARTDIESVL